MAAHLSVHALFILRRGLTRIQLPNVFLGLTMNLINCPEPPFKVCDPAFKSIYYLHAIELLLALSIKHWFKQKID